jgi:predicted SAM-dependent methyltransferase
MLRRAIRNVMARNLRRAIREVQAEWQTARLHRASVKRAQRLDLRRARLNLGSGKHPKTGWINIDLGDPSADLRLDLREPLPFPNDTVSWIYSEHFFEHLNYASVGDPMAWTLEREGDPSEALSFLRECHRVLLPGGVIDLVVPDAEMIISEYASRQTQPFPLHGWWGPTWCDTPMHIVNYVFRQGCQHKYAYDCETLVCALQRTGFVNITRRPFDPSMDADNHQIGSLCVRAAKP